MTHYLHLASLRYHFLVDALHIHEVLEPDAAAGRLQPGRVLWRGSSIPVLDLRKMLGEADPPPPRWALIYGEDTAPPAMLLCDRVFGLLKAGEADFRHLPPAAGGIVRFADSVLPNSATGRLFFHLKPEVLREQLA